MERTYALGLCAAGPPKDPNFQHLAVSNNGTTPWNLKVWKGLLASYQELISDMRTGDDVDLMATHNRIFFKYFAKAMSWPYGEAIPSMQLLTNSKKFQKQLPGLFAA
ncbi:hypothetical protein CDL15_Pgr008034 [Punica granatum]|uniref:Uncharacterized protein n=1 Tax=Punica granatum TaxID=22663 RepID=A0A218VSE1_PUNGR|nr:hypothetical protein CDL15_Pgr008034 [Punica granatum]